MLRDVSEVTVAGSGISERCPHYSIKNERPGACEVATSKLEPDMIRETYFCKTNEYKSCLIYTGHKLCIFKKQRAV
ncbi:hypothetical protein MNBD_DELTA01-670 [hydrothermal vent metagenome]|uniref:Uncharacterized protein n=1 Tax=hydrothermal vent metagenome TaxID=652676 RepID=A0A3B0RI04_9ZZZZ